MCDNTIYNLYVIRQLFITTLIYYTKVDNTTNTHKDKLHVMIKKCLMHQVHTNAANHVTNSVTARFRLHTVGYILKYTYIEVKQTVYKRL